MSKQADIPKRTLESYLSGNTEPKVSKVIDLAASCGVDLRWLMTGEELPKSESLEIESDQNWADIALFDNQKSAENSSATNKPLKTADSNDEVIKKLHGFRYLTSIKFRRPSLQKFGLSADNVVAIRVTGNAMMPIISNEDSVLLDTRETAMRADDAHVFVMASQLLVRRLQLRPNGSALLTADNANLSPIELSSQEELRACWVGKIVWIGRWLINA